ncbi:tetratricopeptide repeat protein [Eudoraea chungangensis]|uniref:tetratricopeptide repeat protein n=1 Tax=Eudoraea chungangensis TaxID=1481905 RepID=UPI0023EC70A8|nr:tetratricopeptide repeat protein [Eudoraea chungangensis]
MKFFRLRIIIIVFVFIDLALLSGQTLPNSLKASIDSLLENKPISYVEIDKVLGPQSLDTLAITYFIKKALDQDYYAGLSYAFNQKGTVYNNMLNYVEAIDNHQKALDYSIKENNLELKIISLNKLGISYRSGDAIKTALDYHQEALELAESIENPSLETKKNINVALNSIGTIYKNLEQYDLALEQFTSALYLETELNNKIGMAFNYQSIGECLEAQKKLTKALESYRTALAIYEEIGAEDEEANCKNSIAQIYIIEGDLKMAMAILDPLLITVMDSGEKELITAVLISKGWAYMENNDFREAEINLKKGLKIAQENHFINYMSSSNKLLSELYTKTGSYQKSLFHYKEAEKFTQKVTSDLNLNYVSDVIVKYATDKKNNQIEVLAKENEIINLKLRRNKNYLLVGGLLLALFTLILYILYRQYQLKSDKKMLTLEQSMLRSQMNPHFLFNSLNSIKLYIINNEKKNAVHYLNKFSKLVRKILEASSLKEILLAEELETAELYMNIENIRFSNEIEFKVAIEPEVDPHLIKIPSLILQPFLENALWHGLSSKEGEKSILVHVTKEKREYIMISIIDNGVGRDMAEKLKENKVLKRKSIGIEITKERLSNFSRDYQNKFNIEIIDLFDEKGRASGTKVILHIPTL